MASPNVHRQDDEIVRRLRRQRRLDAVDRLAAMGPLPAPESLSEWNREYSRLKVGEAAGCLPLDDKKAT